MSVRRFLSFTLLIVAATFAAAATACESDSGNASEPTPSPDLFGRVNIRQGFFSRTGPFATASFSAVLPEGWAASDLPAHDFDVISNYPMGVIVKEGTDAVLRYTVMPLGEARIAMTSGYVVETIDVEGVKVDVHRPSRATPEAGGYRFHAVFEEVPGGAGESDRFSLEFSGSGLSLTEVDEAQAIIESVRREPPLTLPQPPAPQVTPGPDWQRVNAHGFHFPESYPLSVLAPPGWTFEPEQGIDTFVGTFTDGETEIHVMYGTWAGLPVEPEDEAMNPASSPQHEMWEEAIDGKQITFFKAEPGHSGPLAVTGIYTDRIPGLPNITPSSPGTGSSLILSCGGAFWANTSDPEQQELVLAILRTLQAERQSEACG